MALKIMISVLWAVALVVMCIAVIKVQDSQQIRIEKMTQNLDSIGKMQKNKNSSADNNYLSSNANMSEKMMWGGGKSGGKE